MIERVYLNDDAEKFPIRVEPPYPCRRAPSSRHQKLTESTPATKDTRQIFYFGELLSAESVFNEKEEGQAPTAAALARRISTSPRRTTC